ncbi:hypothetical protein BS78_10G220400 [Paspalum vaginatum]|nr:hypothetical protein BS78_10G220400 [Paspalum vaginatum]
MASGSPCAMLPHGLCIVCLPPRPHAVLTPIPATRTQQLCPCAALSCDGPGRLRKAKEECNNSGGGRRGERRTRHKTAASSSRQHFTYLNEQSNCYRLFISYSFYKL